MAPRFYFPAKYKDHAKDFFCFYDIEEAIACSSKQLKLIDQRICRFCRKDSSSTTFSKAAHAIPELLGNHAFLSDSECDVCNKIFGYEYESHLAHFLGISRTLLGIKGKNKQEKNKVPNFTSPKPQMTATFDTADNPHGTVILERKNELDSTFSVDKSTGHTTVKFKSNPYVPLKVYKAFLKMALSCLPERYLKDYKLAFEYLMTDKIDAYCKPYTTVSRYTLPPAYGLEVPVCILFKKKTSQSDLFTHIFQLYVGDSIFQIIVPLQMADAYYSTSGNTMRAYLCPPLFSDQETAEIISSIGISESTCTLWSPESCTDGWGVLYLPVERKKNAEGDDVDYDRIVRIEISREPLK